MTITIQNVAKTAGVSRSTASMILAGRAERYASDTRDKVTQAALELGYRPNIAGRSLSQKRSFLIGAIFNQLNGNYAGEYLAGMQDRVLDQGCAPTLLIANDPEAEVKALQIMADRRVDGLIVNPTPIEGESSPVVEQIRAMRKAGLPIVELLGSVCAPQVPSVKIDGYRAGYETTKHAIALGCPRPMLVIQDNTLPDAPRNARNYILLDFYRGCDDAVLEAGHKPWHAVYHIGEDWDPLATARSILGDNKPAGLITLSTSMTDKFALLANTQPGLVAENFTLCGVDHLLGRSASRFNKVIIHHSIREATQRATDMLFAMIDGNADELPENVTLPPSIEVMQPAGMMN